MELNLKSKQSEKLKKYDLMNLSKEELVDKLLTADVHNNQLRNIIKKHKNHSFSSVKKTTQPQTKRNEKTFDFSRHHFRHILLNFYYLGWDYQGFVVQEDTSNTIEHYLFEALIKTCLIKDRETSNYHRCGRTDKGVSSFGQTISINIRSKLSKENEHNIQDELNYCKILNSVLPNNIQCIAWCPVPDDFSARFHCNSRTYKYFFPKGNLNIVAMQESLSYLIGVHDFRNLCKMDVANGVVTFIRNIYEARIEQQDNSHSNSNSAYEMFQLTIKGQAFLWHQIRCIIAVLFLIGENKEEPQVVRELLDITKCPRKPNYNLAKDLPLNLFYCEYNNIDNWVYDGSNISHVISTLQKQWTYSSIKSTMMKRMLDDLENICNRRKVDNNYKSLTSCLVQGVDSKIYKPLMIRQKCNALDDRIEHYAKKKKK